MSGPDSSKFAVFASSEALCLDSEADRLSDDIHTVLHAETVSMMIKAQAETIRRKGVAFL
ncbi:MAG: hypothetical protein K2O91_01810 [Lachnospiraceae bacterium]|nr:hypothetical protein [Lachnospiraceae bacterium]